MKIKLLAIVLVLTLTSWAQTATQDKPAAPGATPAAQAQSEVTKTDCPCCQNMKEKGAECCAGNQCCQPQAGKNACCGGKNAMCSRKNASSNGTCCDKMKCATAAGKGCCEQKSGQTAMKCCSGNSCAEHNPGDKTI